VVEESSRGIHHPETRRDLGRFPEYDDGVRLGWASLGLVCIALCACNQVFDLRSTRGPIESDTDGDGIKDVIDNCPFTPNFDQNDSDLDSLGDACDPCPLGPQSGLDADKDGIDDACDACLTGANSDEDGDGLLDGCDPCPAIAGDAADADGDGIGDACDANTTRHHRVFFDGFGPPRPTWNTGFKIWHATAGAFAPDDPAAGNPIYGPWSPEAAVAGLETHIDVVANIPPATGASDLVGVNLIERRNGQALDSCSLAGTTQGTWRLVGGKPMDVAPGIVTFHLFVRMASASYMQIGCRVGSDTAIGGILFNATDTWVPSLITRVATEFMSIDVVE
jgi:hypothetical protein